MQSHYSTDLLDTWGTQWSSHPSSHPATPAAADTPPCQSWLESPPPLSLGIVMPRDQSDNGSCPGCYRQQHSGGGSYICECAFGWQERQFVRDQKKDKNWFLFPPTPTIRHISCSILRNSLTIHQCPVSWCHSPSPQGTPPWVGCRNRQHCADMLLPCHWSVNSCPTLGRGSVCEEGGRSVCICEERLGPLVPGLDLSQ